ncbi:AAA family ATPase [Persephonella sp.]
MKNPFTIGIVTDNTFCNRKREIKELKRFILNGQNVVVYSPRRFGKTSLLKKVVSDLENKDKKFIGIYIDLFYVSTYEDVIQSISKGIIEGIGKDINKSFMKKVKGLFKNISPSFTIRSDGSFSLSVSFKKGTPVDVLIEDVLYGFERYLNKNGMKGCIVFDEFQEITTLSDSKKIEGSLRTVIQNQKDISYIFVGSRRTLLLEIFTDKKRPFYKSSYLYPLGNINKDEFVDCIYETFKETGKFCSKKNCQLIYDLTEGYPYYVQKLSSIVWDLTDKRVTEKIINNSFETLIKMESLDFESIWINLNKSEKTLLKQIGKEGESHVFSKDFLERSGLSVGGVQKGLNSLLKKDLIEKLEDGKYKITDPVMKFWICQS